MADGNNLRRPLPVVAPTVAPDIEIEVADDLDDLIGGMTPNERAALAALIKKHREGVDRDR